MHVLLASPNDEVVCGEDSCPDDGAFKDQPAQELEPLVVHCSPAPQARGLGPEAHERDVLKIAL